MNRYQLIFIIFTTIALAIGSCSPNPPTPDPQPRPDTTTVDTLDTLPVDTVDTIPHQTLDTVWVDTIRRDTLIPLDNNKVVLGYAACYNAGIPDPFLFTNIIYACAELYVRNNEYQKIAITQPESRWEKIVALKEQNPNLKIQIMIAFTVSNTDNYQDGGFSAVSADPVARKKFAKDCLEFVEKWGIDGIEIDWEMPGMSQSGAAYDVAHDVDNFTLMMKELRETLGNKYLLTFAGWVKDKEEIEGGSRGFDIMAVEPYIDWINIMCYEMGAPPQPHNAMSCTGYWDIKRTWSAYQKAGFPTDKMVLGLAWYTKNNVIKGEYTYKQIMYGVQSNPNKYKVSFNYTWQVPYVTIDGTMQGSFDNPNSIRRKGKWANENNLRGLMCWEIASDDKDKSLSHAMWNAMKTRTDTLISYEYHMSDSSIITTPFKLISEQ